jgi:hypothetical protein
LSRRTSFLHFCTSFLWTRASPTVQLDNGDENRDNSPPVQENVPMASTVIALSFCTFFVNVSYVLLHCLVKTVWNHPPRFNFAFAGKSLSIYVDTNNVAGVGTT